MCAHCERYLPLINSWCGNQKAELGINSNKQLSAKIGLYWIYATINYCPICGKDLRGDKSEK